MNWIFPRGWRILRPPRHTERQDWQPARPMFSPEFGGTFTIGGNIGSIVTAGGQPASRRVLLLRRDNFRPAADTWSEADGSYRFDGLSPKYCFILMAVDNEIGDTRTCQYAPDAWDFVVPVAPVVPKER